VFSYQKYWELTGVGIMDKFDNLQDDDQTIDTAIDSIDHDDDFTTARPDELFTLPSEMGRDDVARLLADKTMSPTVVSGQLC